MRRTDSVRSWSGARRRALVVTLALTLATVPAALARSGVGDGTYVGEESNGSNEVKLKVRDGKVTKFTADVYASCGFSNFLITVAYPPSHGGNPIKIRNKRFEKTFSGDPSVEDDKRTISGEFQGKNVAGRIKVEGPCSYNGTYTAKR